MRRIGIVCSALGALIAFVTGIMQRADWFAAERASSMSEHVEWVVSAFWAGLVLLVFGLAFLARSFFAKDEEATFEDYLPQEKTPQPGWHCLNCGAENPAQEPRCLNCGAPYGWQPQQAEGSWQCPVCGRVWDDNASICTACGYDRFAE